MGQSKRPFEGRESPVREEGIGEGKEKSIGGENNQYNALFSWKRHKKETYYFA